MGVSDIWKNYAVKLDADDLTSSVMLGGVTEQNVPTGSEVKGQAADGEAMVRHLSLMSQKPTASFTTLEIARALTAIPSLGLSVVSESQTGITLYQQKIERNGKPAAGSVHRAYTFGDGLLLPGALSIPHQAEASLTCRLQAITDGVNDPLVLDSAASLPGLSASERFTLGPCIIGGKELSGMQSVEIEFGLTANGRSGDGETWDTQIAVNEVRPKIRIQGVDPTWFGSANIPLGGLSCSQANTIIRLRKLKHHDTTHADAEEVHITIAAAGMATIDEAVGSSGTSLVVDVNYDGTNDPFTVATGAALA